MEKERYGWLLALAVILMLIAGAVVARMSEPPTGQPTPTVSGSNR